MQRLAAPALLGLSVGGAMAAPGTFNVFSDLPMFGIYVSTPPVYTPPPGVVMQKNGTRFVTLLTSQQRDMLGSDLKARVTCHAQCDNYDRLGAMCLIVNPVWAPTPIPVTLAQDVT
jgi:hypothetical protein